MQQCHSPYLKTHYEEGDVIIIHHLVQTASGASSDSHINVFWDDTDVCVLLIYFYLKEKMTVNISMESPCTGRTIIDIRQTALTGCDTVSYSFGIWKVTALKALMGGHHLNVLGQLGADEDNLMSEAACYGSKIEGDINS